jgi:50S ribosomal protein L16 3-hydroxylase
LGGLTATEFLRDYWQKKPLLVRNAFPELAWRLSPEDMMELAEEDSVEARIVLEQGKTPWELRQGPFTAKQFKQLPKSHWTLLVQAVDHYLPELADYLEHFSFVPNWRIDDIMVSYAVEGGSVGPHYDQYDVFLIQGIGQRRWQLGQSCDDASPGLKERVCGFFSTWMLSLMNREYRRLALCAAGHGSQRRGTKRMHDIFHRLSCAGTGPFT